MVETSVIVQGIPYDPDKWKEVSEQMRNIGAYFNSYSGGELFWETVGNMEALMLVIEHVNKTHTWIHPSDAVGTKNHLTQSQDIV